MDRKKEGKLQIILRVTLIVAALIQIIYELNWLYVYITVTCEWFQAPMPNYGDLMASHHYMRLLISGILIFLTLKKETLLHIAFGAYEVCIKRFGVLFLLLYQFILLISGAVYGGRYVSSFGFDHYMILSMLQPLPLFFAFLLLLCNKISGRIAGCAAVLDTVLYLMMEWGNYERFSLYTPYYDVYSRILFCVVMILFILISRWADKKR